MTPLEHESPPVSQEALINSRRVLMGPILPAPANRPSCIRCGKPAEVSTPTGHDACYRCYQDTPRVEEVVEALALIEAVAR